MLKRTRDVNERKLRQLRKHDRKQKHRPKENVLKLKRLKGLREKLLSRLRKNVARLKKLKEQE